MLCVRVQEDVAVKTLLIQLTEREKLAEDERDTLQQVVTSNTTNCIHTL
jgi:hypothetical protein